MKIQVEVRGLDEWLNWTAVVGRETNDNVKDAVRETTFMIERTAKLLAPVDTGYLRRNIIGEYDASTGTGTVTSNAEYGIYVEFGTSKMSARPHMIPAAQKHVPDFQKKVQDAARKAGE